MRGFGLRSIGEPQTQPAPIRRILNEKESVFGLSAISLWEAGKKHHPADEILTATARVHDFASDDGHSVEELRAREGPLF